MRWTTNKVKTGNTLEDIGEKRKTVGDNSNYRVKIHAAKKEVKRKAKNEAEEQPKSEASATETR